MNAARLLAHYDRIADAPDAIPRLRRFVLDWAVRGKLVPQSPNDVPASQYLKEIAAFKAQSGSGRARRGREGIQALAVETTLTELPPSWVRVTFGDIVMSRDGERIPVSKEERNQRAKLFDYYGASGIIDKIDNYLFDKPLLLIGEDGANLINRSTPIAFMARGKYWVNNHAHVLDGPSEDFLRYLELFINATDLRPYVTGTAQPKMNQAKMNSIPVALPPVAEQRRIVAKVDELMALCDELETAHANSEEMRERFTIATFTRLNATQPNTFTHDVRLALDALPTLTTRRNQIKQLRRTILDLAVSSKLGSSIPGKQATVGSFRSLQNGYAFKSEWFSKKGIRLLRNANIGHGEIHWDDTVFLPSQRVKEFERFLLHEGDIVLTLDRPFIVTGTKVARVTASDVPSLLLQRVGRFVETAPGLSDDYLLIWINSPHFNDQINPGRSNGVPHISSRQVEAAQIFVPLLSDQKRIVATVNQLMNVCDRLDASLAETDDIRHRLLEALLGEALNHPAEAGLLAAE